jgi:serine O-acetyltransferase
MRPQTPDKLWAISRRLYQAGWVLSARWVKTLNYYLHGCLLPAEAEVGNSVILEHYALGVVIHPQVIIGSRCKIYHQTTLATQAAIGSQHFIILEDDVTIGAHSIVISRPNRTLRIGRASVIGAGSVVTRDVPAWEVWAGNPARFIRKIPPRDFSS